MKRRIPFVAVIAALFLLLGNSAFAVTEVSNTLSEKPVVKVAKSYDEILGFIKKHTQYNDTMIEDEVVEESLEEVIEDVAEATGGASSSLDYSQTNVQTEGVDESDVVKTDGKYIYYMRPIGRGYRFSIVETSASGKMKEVATKSFVSSGSVNLRDSEMYITPNKAILLFSEYGSSNQRANTTALIYDITSKSNVTLFREFVMTGYKLTSRLIGENLYLATSEPFYVPSKSEPTTALLPSLGDGKIAPIATNDFYYMPDNFAQSFLTIAGINVNDKKPASAKSIMAGVNSNSIYASKSNMYFTGYPTYNGLDLSAFLHKFSVSGGKVNYVSTGAVNGSPLNQFAMDEYNGNLRIATTAHTGMTSLNNLYVLDSKMNTIGRLEGLAPTERIYSVRYDRHMAYMVTFRQTDPLYAIDVSDPKKPVVKGFLKIPGFSSYMHPIDDDLMVGIGKDADASGRTMGVKLSMFDVSNPDRPKELHVLTMGGQGSSSPTEQNHKTLIYDSTRRQMCFPVYLNNVTPSNAPKLIVPMDPNATVSVFNGFLVVEVDKKTGFKLKAAIPVSAYDIARGVRMGDVLYVIGGDMISSNSLTSYKKIAELKLK